MRARLTVVAVVAVALATAVGSFGSFVRAGAGTGQAGVGAVNAPTGVTVPSASAGTVHVTWAASATGAGAVAPAGYLAERRGSGPAWAPACGTGPGALVVATSCDDPVGADGTYTYRVTAVYRSWTAASAPSAAVAVDRTAPVASIAFPAAGPYGAAAWIGGCTTPLVGDVCGTASDAGAAASGVAAVEVQVQRASDGRYWNGGTWSATPVWKPATGTTSWSYPLAVASLADGAAYTVRARAVDGAGNTQTTPGANTFTYDTTGPSVTVEQKAGQADPAKSVPLRWTVTFGEAVADFDVTDLTRSGTSSGGTVAVTGSGASYEIALSGTPTDGTVGFAVAAGRAHDAAGNGNTASVSADDTIAYDATAPTATIDQAVGQVDPVAAAPILFTVAFSEPVSDFATGDVRLSGTAGATTATVTGGPTTYTVSVGGMTGNGTVIASLDAGVATDAAGNASAASTSADGTVTYAAAPAALTPTALTIANGSSPNVAGKAEPGDRITITWSSAIQLGSVCSSWTSAAQTVTGLTVTMDRGNGNHTNDLGFSGGNVGGAACGTLDVGGMTTDVGGYAPRNERPSFGNSTMTWNAASNQLVITLGPVSPVPNGTVDTSTFVYTPSAAIALASDGAVKATGTASTGAVQNF